MDKKIKVLYLLLAISVVLNVFMIMLYTGVFGKKNETVIFDTEEKAKNYVEAILNTDKPDEYKEFIKYRAVYNKINKTWEVLRYYDIPTMLDGTTFLIFNAADGQIIYLGY